jgi:hypothetical protein
MAESTVPRWPDEQLAVNNSQPRQRSAKSRLDAKRVRAANAAVKTEIQLVRRALNVPPTVAQES